MHGLPGERSHDSRGVARLTETLSMPTAAATHRRVYRRHQWRTLALATAAFAASAPGQSFLISVFVDDFLAGTGLTRTTFSLLYAAGTVVSAVAMTALGRVVDHRGLRAAWIVVSLGLALACALASVAAGAALAFVALALLRTAGQGSFTLIGTLLVAGSFGRRRGQAVAVANLGVTLASVATPPLVALLIVQTDWRVAYRVLALVLLLLVLPLAVLVRPGPPRRSHVSAGSTAMPPFPSAVRPGPLGLQVPTAGTTRLLVVLAVPPLIGTAVTFHAVSLLASRDIGYLAASSMVGLLGLCSALGVVLAGVVVDRISTRTGLVLLSAVELVAVLIILVPTAAAATVGFAVLGLGMGGVGVLNGTVWARTFGTAGLGRVQGLAQSSMIAAAAVAPLLPALSLGLTDSHQPGLLVLATLAVAAVALATRPCPAPPPDHRAASRPDHEGAH